MNIIERTLNKFISQSALNAACRKISEEEKQKHKVKDIPWEMIDSETLDKEIDKIIEEAE